MKICLVEGEFFLADRWTDMMKLIVAFCNLVDAPRRCIIQLCHTSVLLI